MQLTIITGLSGAGRSSALRTLEDMGFFCSDNIPPALIPSFARLCMERPSASENVALVADMRMGDMFDSIYYAIDELGKMGIKPAIIFLDASDEVLVSRFKQTRRRHPVSGSGKIITGILEERDKLQRIKEMADMVIDTSTYSVRALKATIEKLYSGRGEKGIQVSVITFGFKRGLPLDADLVFDMRFLPNPFYIQSLRTSTGLDEEVSNYVLSFDAASEFLNNAEKMILSLAPHFLEQDKKQLVVGVGCTGGMHRSVAMGEELAKRLRDKGQRTSIEHRDLYLEKDAVTKRFLKAVRIDD